MIPLPPNRAPRDSQWSVLRRSSATSFQRDLRLYLRAPCAVRTEAADLEALGGAGEEEGPPQSRSSTMGGCYEDAAGPVLPE